MRTFFELEEHEAFHAAQALLVHRCVDWAEERGLPADPVAIVAALDSRQLSMDGRLAWWTPAHVRQFLLEWVPLYLPVDAADLKNVPGSLITLLRFLADCGLWDPRGASVAEAQAAVTSVAAEYQAAVADPERQGIRKFWAIAARDNGVDVTDPEAMSRFARDIESGQAVYDEDLLVRLMDAQLGPSGLMPERAIAQLPVTLPPAGELAAAAARSQVVVQLRAFTEWVGTDGRTLTAAGNLRPADARELIALLRTGEEHLKVRSSAELPQLNLIFAWARKARLVRVSRGRLLPVAKARPLLDDGAAEALWQRAFEAFFELRDVICVALWAGGATSLLYELYAEAIPDVLNTIYSLPLPMPVVRLNESVWDACRQVFAIGARSSGQQQAWREHVGRDLASAFEALAALGAVEVTHGLADQIFTSDLATDVESPLTAGRSFPADALARLAGDLAVPGDLVALTALGTRAMRERLLAQGREAGLVGDLVAAQPAELLGVVAEHYTPETGVAEIAGWLAARGGDIELLLDAIRACPFRCRAAAMLSVLAAARPDRTRWLRSLRADPVLAPLVLQALTEDGTLEPGDLTEPEQVLVMTEGLLQLLELGGPDAVRGQLTQLPAADLSNLLRVTRACGHPGKDTMRDFQELVVGPLMAAPRHLSLVPSPGPGARRHHPGQDRKRRRS